MSKVEVLDAGIGYAGDIVELIACPIACCSMHDEICCLETPTDAVCRLDKGKMAIQDAQITGEVGLRGGVAGNNFDRCLEAVIDRSSCKCGSGIEDVQLVLEGSGFVNGVLAAYLNLPNECDEKSICETKSINTTNKTFINITTCKPLAPPNFCNSLANATGFKATFNVAPTRRCPDEFYPSGASDVSALFPGKTLLNSSGLYWGYIQGQEDYLKDAKGTTNLSRCMNRSASRGVSGAISGFNITAAGQGYNSSTVSLRLLYAGATRCARYYPSCLSCVAGFCFE